MCSYQLSTSFWKAYENRTDSGICLKFSFSSFFSIISFAHSIYFGIFFHVLMLYSIVGPNSHGKGSSGKECHSIKLFSYEDLSLFTDGFSQKNFIDNFQFGRVFHGKVEARQVTVKIREIPKSYRVLPGDNGSRLRLCF